jgi:hypothetical protein
MGHCSEPSDAELLALAETLRESLHTAKTAALPVEQAAGWVLVPRDPTGTMILAAEHAYVAWKAQCDREFYDDAPCTKGTFTHSDTYRAMLAAAPSAVPAQQAAVTAETSVVRKFRTTAADLKSHADNLNAILDAIDSAPTEPAQAREAVPVDEVEAYTRWARLEGCSSEQNMQYVWATSEARSEWLAAKQDAATPGERGEAK